MVFGNMGESSATGVAFTRDPSTGEKRFYGEYLVNAQGEDVVAGIRTPAPISNSRKADLKSEDLSLEEAMPEVYAQLIASLTGWKSTIATCRTSSSRWSRASSTCCRPATGSARRRRR
jgi:phosphoenolpyruvate synthase/pyruvate phosphate dikinase